LGHLFYKLFIFTYNLGIRIVAIWNTKAKDWVQGRKESVKFTFSAYDEDIVWMHCASLGEFEQGRPVLEALKAKNANIKIVLTFFSPSGYNACKNYKGAAAIFYLPMDSKKNATFFLDAIKPNLILWVKYEYWYHYLAQIKKRQIPLLLVSGIFRKDQPFFKWYGSLWREMLTNFNFLFVQNDSSKQLLSKIGIKDNIVVVGDTRFDRVAAIANNFEPLPLIEKFCGDSKVFVAGSTWEEDEEELVHYVKTHPGIKFIIAPHEIDAENIKEVQQRFTNSVLYSQLNTANLINPNSKPQTPNCLIIDNIGMLSRLYFYADICYIGGGFGDDGVHNVLEAAVYGKPLIFGPVYDKFKEAVDLVDAGGAIIIEDALTLEKALDEIFNDTKVNEEMSETSLQYVKQNIGATQKIINYIYENRLLTN
jgi:3-deoxy-D-manno-octulosonic-acid transferase